MHDSPMTESATVPAAGATKTALDSADTPDADDRTQERASHRPPGARRYPLSRSERGRPPSRPPTWPGAGSGFPSPASSARTSWWQEGRPEEGGRMTVVHCGADGKPQALLPAPWNARTRVHEYGGLSYLPVPRASARPRPAGGKPPRGHAIVFANYADQRLYLAGMEAPGRPGAAPPRPLTPDPAAIGASRPGRGGAAFRRLRALPRPQGGLVRTGTARRRQGQPVDSRRAAGRLGGR